MAHANQVGADGLAVLTAGSAADAPVWLRELPAVEFLRQVWIQQYQVSGGTVSWRDKKDLPPAALRYCSPYDPQARTGTKRDASWNGYKVHLTETCEPDAPHLITHVATTPAPVPDMAMTAEIHARLAQRDLLPEVHLVDAGYIDAEHLLTSQEKHGIELLGPAKHPTGWQATAEDGYTLGDFAIDWDNERVTCPNGASSSQWSADQSQDGVPVIRVRPPLSRA